MRFEPAGDPGTPDDRSATRYLVWLAGRHPVDSSAAGIALGVVWMVAQALMPAAVGRAIDAGLTHRDPRRPAAPGALVLLGLGVRPGGRRHPAAPVRGATTG